MRRFPIPSSFFIIFIMAMVLLSACSSSRKANGSDNNTSKKKTGNSKNHGKINPNAKVFIKPLDVDRNAFVKYAKTLLGTKYLYGSTNPKNGLDCSGFIYNVFQHFNVSCPRVTKDYTNEGREVSRSQARIGDIILFTGSNHSSGIVGHMGIITREGAMPQFIHSASGKNVGVIINDLKGYYETHFVKIISVLR